MSFNRLSSKTIRTKPGGLTNAQSHHLTVDHRNGDVHPILSTSDFREPKRE